MRELVAEATSRRALANCGFNGTGSGKREEGFLELPESHFVMAAFLPSSGLTGQTKGGSSIPVARLEAPSVPALMREEGDAPRSSPPGSSGPTAPSLMEDSF